MLCLTEQCVLVRLTEHEMDTVKLSCPECVDHHHPVLLMILCLLIPVLSLSSHVSVTSFHLPDSVSHITIFVTPFYLSAFSIITPLLPTYGTNTPNGPLLNLPILCFPHLISIFSGHHTLLGYPEDGGARSSKTWVPLYQCTRCHDIKTVIFRKKKMCTFKFYY